MNLFSKDDFIFNVKSTLRCDYATSLERAKDYEIYNSVSKVIMKLIAGFWESDSEVNKHRKAYYLSSEFLMGRALGNNLSNLEIYDEIKESLHEIGLDIDDVEKREADAGLGNGGLGRLAACFLDSAATHNFQLHGYGIRYEYGIFRQVFENNKQVEKADTWLKYGDPWSIRRESEKKLIEFSDQRVYAIPYDTPIIGYDSLVINTLRLWRSEPIEEFNYELFNNQEYDAALSEANRAADISRVLYPNDSRIEGKVLRLKQQYFFTSASIQDLVEKHKIKHGDLTTFADFNTVQLNDTHPAVAVAELTRLLMDKEGFTFEDALKISRCTFNYTNHTILQEALEKWDQNIYREKLPRIYEIIEMINAELIKDLEMRHVEEEKAARMHILQNGQIHMAHLAIFGSRYVNGVAKVHTSILKDETLKDWNDVYPQKIRNITNGVTQRRWLNTSNRELAKLLTKLLGNKKWVKELKEFNKLESKQYEPNVIEEFIAIKRIKKQELAEYILEKEGIEIDPDAVFDIQIKRLHEYKRQLLNAFLILDYYFKIKEGKYTPKTKSVHIFGAKSAPGYRRAKGIIQFILQLADMVNNDPDVNKYMKVVFVTNYNVSYAQKLFPAGDISEQISTAGKEASGTGNMKFMMNGAVTLGTVDGANIEIFESAGESFNYVFGLTVDEVRNLRGNYDPKHYYNNVEGLKRVVDTLIDGTFDDTDGVFKEIHDSILYGSDWEMADQYFLMADFDSYRVAHNRALSDYAEKEKWAIKALTNIIKSSRFSSDRSIANYAKHIWDIENINK